MENPLAITVLLALLPYLVSGLKWIKERLDDNGLQAAVTRSETEMELAAKLDRMGQHAWAAETRDIAQRRPLKILIKFEIYRQHTLWNLFTALWPGAYVLGAVAVFASTLNVPTNLAHGMLMVDIALFILSVVMCVTWSTLRITWFESILNQKLRDRTQQIKLRRFQVGRTSDPRDTLTS